MLTYTYIYAFYPRVLFYAWELHCPTVCANMFYFKTIFRAVVKFESINICNKSLLNSYFITPCYMRIAGRIMLVLLYGDGVLLK